MKIYIIIYSDYHCSYQVLHVFTNEEKAKKCKEYELKKITLEQEFGDYGDYGKRIDIIEKNCSDELDFDFLITELDKLNKRKRQAIDDEIKAKDLSEFNRIKEKYNLNGWHEESKN